MLSLLATLVALSSLFTSSQALYFYLDGTAPKCFYEDLPKDTLVVGTYKSEAYSPQTQSFHTTGDLSIQVTVEEVFDNDHRVVTQTTTSSDTYSKFTFTAADPGLHRLCFTPSGPAAISVGGWFSNAGASTMGGVKLTVDMAIGATSRIESEDKSKIDNIVSKVKELNGRLTDIRREQVFQRVRFQKTPKNPQHHIPASRMPGSAFAVDQKQLTRKQKQEREAEFRDQSEATNAKIVRWTLIQLGVLGVTCAWQLSHLRAFFIKQKLT